MSFELTFLHDGGQSAESVAGRLRSFIAQARRSLDVAIYDFKARDGASGSVADALEAAHARGVAVRVVFTLEPEERERGYAGVRRPPISEPEEIDGLDVPTRGVRGDGALMHHKYVVRDGEAVWTGSTNWTDDAFSREENLILEIQSEPLAAAYGRNFDQLWTKRKLRSSGGSGRATRIDGTVFRPFFSPKGPSLPHLVAGFIGEARRRVRILTPVMTSGAILGTVAELAGRQSFDFGGAYDLTQMEEVQSQWTLVPANHWKLDAWKSIARRLSGKRSTPYSKHALHDYMHAKAIVVDDEVLTGSYNCSRGGAENAENVLHVRANPVADRFADFADRIAARYRDEE
jgi:phosphatidylserine/phosphatidylglycerophosphate/cardiolipin synthase-like enzyme